MQNRLICMQFTVPKAQLLKTATGLGIINATIFFVAFRNGFVIVTDGKSDQTVTQLESQQSAEGLVQKFYFLRRGGPSGGTLPQNLIFTVIYL